MIIPRTNIRTIVSNYRPSPNAIPTITLSRVLNAIVLIVLAKNLTLLDRHICNSSRSTGKRPRVVVRGDVVGCTLPISISGREWHLVCARIGGEEDGRERVDIQVIGPATRLVAVTRTGVGASRWVADPKRRIIGQQSSTAKTFKAVFNAGDGVPDTAAEPDTAFDGQSGGRGRGLVEDAGYGVVVFVAAMRSVG